MHIVIPMSGVDQRFMDAGYHDSKPLIVGTFYFRKVKYFNTVLENLVEKDIRVNGEFYFDSLVNELIKMSLTVNPDTIQTLDRQFRDFKQDNK
jgi:hypothetical protein